MLLMNFTLKKYIIPESYNIEVYNSNENMGQEFST